MTSTPFMPKTGEVARSSEVTVLIIKVYLKVFLKTDKAQLSPGSTVSLLDITASTGAPSYAATSSSILQV